MRNLLLCLLLILPITLDAQHRIELFPNTISARNGAWNLQAWLLQMDGLDAEGKGFLTLTILDEQKRLLYKARSDVFQFSTFKQPRSLSALSLESMGSDPVLDQWIQVSGCLPEGIYYIQLQLFSIRNQLLANKEMLWRPNQPCQMPLQLIAPAHQSTLSEKQPSFHWTTPFNQLQFPDLQYNLSVVEQFNYQSKEQAILNNPRLFQQVVLQGQLAYPPFGSPLETDHTYSWMVTANWNGRTVGRSQVWSFTLAEKRPERAFVSNNPRPVTYFKTGDPQHPPLYLLKDPLLGFYYKNTKANAPFHWLITDDTGQTFAHRPLDREPGIQYVQLDLSTIGISISEGEKRYRLDILHDNKRLETLFFQF